jgi:hypothetical protein
MSVKIVLCILIKITAVVRDSSALTNDKLLNKLKHIFFFTTLFLVIVMHGL